MRPQALQRPEAWILAGLLLAVVLDLLMGRGVPVNRFVPALLDPGSVEGRILLLVRGPRVATALVAGAALGVAGIVLQAVLRNPLASPDTTGVNSSAVLGVVVVIALALLPLDSTAGFLAAALLSGLAGGMLVYVLGRRLSAERQLLIGMMLAAAMAGGITLFLSLRTSRFSSVVRWLVGSVDGRVWADLTVVGPWVLLGIVGLTGLSGLLPVLSVGDHHARALGLDPVRWRAVLLVGAVVVAAGAAALAGAITFVGLLVPHLVRGLGVRGAAVIPAGAAVGAALLASCDAFAQFTTGVLVAADFSQRVGIPAGAVAALVGAVGLVWVVRRNERAGMIG